MYDGHKLYRYMKPCLDNNIRVYPKGSNTGRYKIIIETNGRQREGKEVYKNEPYQKKESLMTDKGLVEITVTIPAVNEKVFELYKEIAIKNKFVTE